MSTSYNASGMFGVEPVEEKPVEEKDPRDEPRILDPRYLEAEGLEGPDAERGRLEFVVYRWGAIPVSQ